MNFDDNALYRHPDIRDLRDLGEEDPLEIEASKFSLNYIQLDGNIGCMVNGAGLAMATMDIIKLAGGEPANFLDVGGGANAEQIRNAFKILMSDKNVKAVLINIFGGILRCDVLAQGVIAAVEELGVPVPIVIRMEGTNVDEGKRLLRESGMNFTTADSRDDRAPGKVRSGPCHEVQCERLDLCLFVIDKIRRRLMVQGLTGREGTFHAQAGGGVRHDGCRRRDARQGRHDTRGLADLQHGGRRGAEDRRERVGDFRAARVAADAVMEAADAGIALVVCITEGIPTLDMMRAMTFLEGAAETTAGGAQLSRRSSRRARPRSGIIPGHICKEGRIGIVSKSGTLTYEAIHQLTRLGMGQTTCIGIGGDPLIGTSHIDALELFAADPDTDAVIMIGEIGGRAEEEAAAWIEAQLQQAGGRLHRRTDRAARAAHGPRRRHRRRRERARRPKRWRR